MPTTEHNPLTQQHISSPNLGSCVQKCAIETDFSLIVTEFYFQ